MKVHLDGGDSNKEIVAMKEAKVEEDIEKAPMGRAKGLVSVARVEIDLNLSPAECDEGEEEEVEVEVEDEEKGRFRSLSMGLFG